MWGIDRWGLWLLGIIAIIWTLDSFVGFYLTLPLRRRARAAAAAAGSEPARSFWQRWKPAWKLRLLLAAARHGRGAKAVAQADATAAPLANAVSSSGA